MNRLGVALLGAFVIAIAGPARAQSRVSLHLQTSARHVGVGQTFRVQLSAMVEGGGSTPQNPRLSLPPGISARGPSVASQTQMSINNGQIDQRQGISATWLLTASRPGTYRIGPARVSVGGTPQSSESITVQVDTSGAGSPSTPPSPFGFNPFNPFSGMPGMPSLPGLGSPFDNDTDNNLDSLPPYPDDLRVDHAPDRTAFLRATVTPQRAVVGQEVRLRIYAYGHPSPFREANTSEASRTDFLAYSIVDNSYGEQQYRVPIDGQVWFAMKVREVALFPMHAGTLTIGPMTMGFDGRGYPSQGMGRGLVRKSPPVQVVVTEPPLDGRPAGYRIGDVGRYALSATVDPRSVKAGDAVSVIVKLEGTGNLPYQIKTPEQRGVEFLQPTVTDDVGPHGSAIGGWRKFSYVVRLDKPGQVALGAVTLPYWNPSTNSYGVARADLGKVEVAPNPGAPPADDTQRSDALAGLLKARATLGAPAHAPLRLADRRWFWLALLAGPLGVVATSGSIRVGKRIGERMKARRSSHRTLAQQALDEAATAARAGDGAGAASAVERAVFTAVEAAVGLKARAVLRPDLPAELEQAGLSADAAREIVAVLESCDGLRFTGEAAHAPSDLVERAGALVRRLLRGNA